MNITVFKRTLHVLATESSSKFNLNETYNTHISNSNTYSFGKCNYLQYSKAAFIALNKKITLNAKKKLFTVTDVSMLIHILPNTKPTVSHFPVGKQQYTQAEEHLRSLWGFEITYIYRCYFHMTYLSNAIKNKLPGFLPLKEISLPNLIDAYIKFRKEYLMFLLNNSRDDASRLSDDLGYLNSKQVDYFPIANPFFFSIKQIYCAAKSFNINLNLPTEPIDGQPFPTYFFLQSDNEKFDAFLYEYLWDDLNIFEDYEDQISEDTDSEDNVNMLTDLTEELRHSIYFFEGQRGVILLQMAKEILSSDLETLALGEELTFTFNDSFNNSMASDDQ